MLYGTMANGTVTLATGAEGAKAIEETAEPSAPVGYHAVCDFVEGTSAITQTWRLVPDAGTAQEATLALAQMQAASLTDAQALQVAALYPEWSANAVCYAEGDRVLHLGILYKAVSDVVSAEGEEPPACATKWAAVTAE